MSSTRLTNTLLAIITIALVVLAARPYLAPPAVRADDSSWDPMYFEPGVYMLRKPQGGQVLGKVAVNLRTGNVYGFPTTTSDPYPASPIDNKPQISHAIPLGHFALEEAR